VQLLKSVSPTLIGQIKKRFEVTDVRAKVGGCNGGEHVSNTDLVEDMIHQEPQLPTYKIMHIIESTHNVMQLFYILYLNTLIGL
jgi:hypothetical protein